MKLGTQVLAKAWICIVLHLRGFVWFKRWCSGKQAYSWGLGKRTIANTVHT
jgi:hypothetical protein